ncbi:putative E3 ubiquitin-protein ligase UBR7 [Drosophila subobscura]|uniref:putative E3 ubiquitin-protein ligase UBR7 n=1 Tax=Drosophila subobscura TaxID=7241 RepID=UPI00155A5511|nr:putative E3 ubiquitin-protein ligase UBR7 [Drosophila subobscura]
MSEMNSKTTDADVEEANALEQSTITMVDVLEQEKEMEDEYAAVLGASDEKACTYAKGPIQRQALYSCLTCCPEARTDLAKCAGVCLACSYRCHENHELVELYTKRNFRCDCPTLRLGTVKRCCLNPQLDAPQPPNDANLYNQNFQGLYCSCKRPYPDPERTTEEVMLQCAVCEDWYHLPHMKAPGASEKMLDACSEMICDTCMDKNQFLRDYTGLALQPVEAEKESKAVAEEEQVDAEPEQSEEPASKRPKLTAEDCRRPNPTKKHQGAAFWTNDWRKSLCQCTDCLALFKEFAVEFLLDVDDSAKTYEERGMQRAVENSSYEQGMRALSSIDRTQQIDAITEYNRMTHKLKDYLKSFALQDKVVKEEDIKAFFSRMKDEPKPSVGQPHFCR